MLYPGLSAFLKTARSTMGEGPVAMVFCHIRNFMPY